MYCYTYENNALGNVIDLRTPAFLTPEKDHRILFSSYEDYPLYQVKIGVTPVGIQLRLDKTDHDKRALLWLKDLPHPKGQWETTDSLVLADGATTLLVVPDGGKVCFYLDMSNYEMEDGTLDQDEDVVFFTLINRNGKMFCKNTGTTFLSHLIRIDLSH